MPRQQKLHHYIYKTTCLVTGKFYVGMHSTDTLDDGYLGSGKILRYSIAKHGRENHQREIIETCPSRESLKLREREIVNEELLADPLNINLKYGGEGGGRIWGQSHLSKFTGSSRTAKLRGTAQAKEISVNAWKTRRSNNNTARFEKPCDWTGRKHKDVSITKMRESAKRSRGTWCWVTNGNQTVRISLLALESYLENGYVRGRTTK